MSSKYVDISANMQVIGSVFINPSLLDMEDKYKFNEEDFPQEFHKILFGTIYNLHQLGAKEISIEEVEKYLGERPKKYAIYKVNKGSEYLKNIKEMSQLAAFDYYYNRMKKMTLLRMYNAKVGIDLSWLYDPDNILDLKKKEAQETWLDNTSIEDIANTINNKIENIKMKYVDSSEDDIIQAGDGAADLLERLKINPEIGYPLYGRLINTIHRGARLKRFYLRSAATGVGKALGNSSIIPTPTGFRKVGDIKPGDQIFDALGNPTHVRAIYPQGKRQVWEVVFEDGRMTYCDEEHLWSYCVSSQSKEEKVNRKFYTDTTHDLQSIVMEREKEVLIPLPAAVTYPERYFSLPPYALGVIYAKSSIPYDLEKCSPQELSGWDLTKRIPSEYFKGAIHQRLELLQGIMDSCGWVEKENTRIAYCCVTSEGLARDIARLCWSLGLKANPLPRFCEDGPFAKVKIYCNPTVRLFKEKKEYNALIKENDYSIDDTKFIRIEQIFGTPFKEDMTCFYVENDEHLFLAEDYIVTHNTRSMIADACNIACNKIYNLEENKWVDNGTSEPTLFITTEQEEDEIQTMMIAFLSGVNEEHILNNMYLEGEEDRVRQAALILVKSPLYIKKLPDFSLQDIENAIKLGIRQYQTRYVFMDYIHSSMKILSEISSKAGVKGLREDNILFMIGVRLKDLCNQYGVFIMSATQLNSSYQTAQQYDQNLLRGAKSLGDKIDCGMIMLQASQDDKTSLKEIVNSMGVAMPDIKISVYKNRRGRYKDILLWCKSDRGICRIDPLFVTDYNYELIEIEDLKINVKPRKEE
jgi:replicative DNA helicase